MWTGFYNITKGLNGDVKLVAGLSDTGGTRKCAKHTYNDG